MDKTQAMSPQADPNRTMAMAAPQSVTQAWKPEPTIRVQVVSSREATLANGPAREQFLVEIDSPTQEGLPGLASQAPRTALNLCLVIDRSGSMEGAPLNYVKQACHHVVDLLNPDDILSIISFSDVAEVLMPPQRVTNKAPIKQGIDQLQPGNTTNLYDALSFAMQSLQQGIETRRATRMVVLSDGDPTSGIKDYPTLVQHAEAIKNAGITMTFLGFGPDYNEELLAGMAKKSGGNYYFIPRPELIPEIFRAELQKLLSVAATNLMIELKLSRWVNLKAATGLAALPTGNTLTLPLTDLERGSTLQQIFDLEFPNHPLGHYRVAQATLRYDNTASGQSESVPIDLVMEFTADAARYGAARNPRVTQAADVAAASRLVEKTIMGLKTGQLTQMAAIQDLQKTQALLVQDGRTIEAQEVTMALRALQSGDLGGAEKTLMGTVVQLDQGKRQS